jgi:thioredoxin reductase (NADPH)
VSTAPYDDVRPGVGPGGEDTPLDVDILVVGAGPVGLFGAYYAGFRGLRVGVIDSLPEVGGQISAMYPEKLIHDVAGFPAVRGRDLVDSLVEQAAPFSPRYVLGEQASTLCYDADGSVRVVTSTGRQIHAQAVVVTGGIGTFTPRPLPAGTAFDGRGLRYFVRELADLAERDVVIVGGGDSAFDWAHSLEPIARSVVLVHRRKNFRAHEHTVQQVLASRVDVVTDCQVTKIVGDLGSPVAECVEAVEITHVPSGEVRTLTCQAVVAALGFTADLGPLMDWGLEIVERHIVVDTRMATNRPRIFAAGDITDYVGKVRLIAVGFGEVATAVNNAATILDPDAPLFPGHSTDEAPARPPVVLGEMPCRS